MEKAMSGNWFIYDTCICVQMHNTHIWGDSFGKTGQVGYGKAELVHVETCCSTLFGL